MALWEGGTLCSLGAFTPSAGNVHTFCSQSTSVQRASLTSRDLAAGNTRNSKARRVAGSALDFLILVNASGTSE